MAVELPVDSHASKAITDECYSNWETGGRVKLYDLLTSSLSHRLQSTSTSTSKSQSDPFSLLLISFLTTQILTPKLKLSSFSSLFLHLLKSIPVNQSSSTKDPSSSNDSGSSKDLQTFQELLLNVVSIIHFELELRNDLTEQAPLEITGKMTQLEKARKLTEHKDEGNVLLEGEGIKPLKLEEARNNLVGVVRELVITNCLPQEQVNEHLEPPILAALQVVPDLHQFQQKEVRLSTQATYKQSKFNLLREENEGYAALINALANGTGPPTIPVYSQEAEASQRGLSSLVQVIEQETPSERNSRAKKVMENLSTLIGHFDLDPTRVLDIILDFFASSVVKHWPFFLALLLVSPWGRDRRTHSSKEEEEIEDDESRMDLDGNGKEESTSIPPFDFKLKEEIGSTICAQVLGFKYQFYLKDRVKEDVPKELYLATALLIKEGVVRLGDLMTHLVPLENQMTTLQVRYKEALQANLASARGSNALTMSAPLIDESRPSATSGSPSAAVEEVQAKEPPNQVVGLLQALLGIGQLKQSLFILTRYPWLCSAFPLSIADPFIRLLKVSLEPYLKSVSLVEQHSALDPSALSTVRSKYDVKKQERVPTPPASLFITSQAPEPLPLISSRAVYFVNDWKREIVQCHNEEGFFSTFIPLLKVLGVQLHRDKALLQGLCRLGKARLESILVGEEGEVKEGKGETKRAWVDVIRTLIIPAFTLSEDCGIVEEFWSLLKLLPLTERFAIYGEWKYDLYKKPELKAKQISTEREAKGILKRISADNQKRFARKLAKASHSNPQLFFSVIMNQIQSYENLIPSIVESSRYLTSFEYDVFSWILIDGLSNPEKDRTKADGTNISLWLKSLASFTGSLYKRFFLTMSSIPVLQYIANQLKANNSKDLIIVRELVLKMAGIEPLMNLGEKQIDALTGGRLLRKEAMMVESAGPGTKTRTEFKKTGDSLLKTLEMNKLIVPYLIFISQQRQACVHLIPEDQAHLKYLGNLFDSCQETLFQFCEFLNNHLEPNSYSNTIPDLRALCIRFGLEPSIAFHLLRPKLVWEMKVVDSAETETKLREQVKASKLKAAAAAAAAKELEAEKVNKVAEAEADEDKDVKSSESQVAKSIEAALFTNGDSTPTSSPAPLPLPVSIKPIWHPGLANAIGAAEEFLPDQVKSTIGVHFYVTFWQLALSDIIVPSNRYDQETKLLQQLIRDYDPSASPKVRQQVKEAYERSIRALNNELKEQTLAHSVTRRRLMIEKNHWLPDTTSSEERQEYVRVMFQQCIYPRALLSPTDAIFSGRFIRLMHHQGAKNFSSLSMYDEILNAKSVAPTIFSCTENEARNYAKFLHTVLSDLNPWVLNEKTYLKEAIGGSLPGFQANWRGRKGGEEVPEEDYSSWKDFSKDMHRWQESLKEAFLNCFKSHEYMRIRNAIVVVTRISAFFPVVDVHGLELLKSVQKLCASEQRGDLKILAQGLSATLTKRKKDWVPSHTYQHQDPPANYVPAILSTETTAPPPVHINSTPSGPKADQSKSSLSVPPSGPSRPSLVKTDSSNRSASFKDTKENGMTSRPEAARSSSSSLPARPGQSSSSSGSRTPANGQTALPERVPSGPRADSRSVSSTNNTSAARQAALDSMNPPRGPASTPGAQAARDRGTFDRDLARNGSNSRVSSSSKPRDEVEAPSTKSSAQASPRVGSSRDASPEASLTRKSRAGSVESTGSRSRSGKEREKDRDRDGGRESHSSRSDRDKDRKDRETERSERRNRTSEKETESSSNSHGTPTGPRVRGEDSKEKSRSSSSTANSSKRHRSDRGDEVSTSTSGKKDKGKEFIPESSSSSNGNRDRSGADDREREREKSSGGSSIPQKRSLTDRLGLEFTDSTPASPSDAANTSTESSAKRSKLDRNRNAKYGTFATAIAQAQSSSSLSPNRNSDSPQEKEKDRSKDRDKERSSSSRHRSGEERSSSKRDRSERDKDDKHSSSASRDRSGRDGEKSSYSSKDKPKQSSTTEDSAAGDSSRSRHVPSSRHSSSRADRSADGPSSSSRDRNDEKDRKKRRSGLNLE